MTMRCPTSCALIIAKILELDTGSLVLIRAALAGDTVPNAMLVDVLAVLELLGGQGRRSAPAGRGCSLLQGNHEVLRDFTDEEARLLVALLTRLIANLDRVASVERRPARQFLRGGLTGPSVGG